MAKHYQEYYQGEERQIFNAVWQYLLDHSDLTSDGVLFVKFHTKSKESFAKSIASRMKGLCREGGWKEKVMKERRSEVLNQLEMRRALEKLKNEQAKKDLL
jgi:isocitrate dehydrogenase kinase/phosphatase